MKVSKDYLEKVDLILMSGVNIERSHLTTAQKFRLKIVYEAYQMWVTDKAIAPNDLLRRIASREYSVLLNRAKEGDEMAQKYVDALGIKPGVPRALWEIANDVATLNHIIGHFHQPTAAIDKAIVHDAGLWLYKHGQDTGDGRDVRAGAKILQELNNNFDEKQNILDSTPTAQINISADIHIIKKDRVNYTEDEVKQISKKVGMPVDDVLEMIQNEQGEYVELEQREDTAEEDYIAKMQEEMND